MKRLLLRLLGYKSRPAEIAWCAECAYRFNRVLPCTDCTAIQGTGRSYHVFDKDWAKRGWAK